MTNLTATREYAAGAAAWKRQNFVMPGYTFTWQNQAYDLGFNTARNADNQDTSTFVRVGAIAAKIVTDLK